MLLAIFAMPASLANQQNLLKLLINLTQLKRMREVIREHRVIPVPWSLLGTNIVDVALLPLLSDRHLAKKSSSILSLTAKRLTYVWASVVLRLPDLFNVCEKRWGNLAGDEAMYRRLLLCVLVYMSERDRKIIVYII